MGGARNWIALAPVYGASNLSGPKPSCGGGRRDGARQDGLGRSLSAREYPGLSKFAPLKEPPVPGGAAVWG